MKKKDQLRELDAAIAVRYFGWKWLRRKHDKHAALFGPKSKYKWYNFIAKQWECGSVTDKRLGDWDRVCGLQYGLPRYSSDVAAAHELIDVLVGMGEGVAISYNEPEIGGGIRVSVSVVGKVYKSFPEGLCREALRNGEE